MGDYRLAPVESRFADMIWRHEPLKPAELVELAQAELGWKRTTTYTVLKRLSERGIFQNKDGKVTALISREEFYSVQSEQFVEENFQGSLPAFLAAFTTRKSLTPEEVAEIRQLIDTYGEE